MSTGLLPAGDCSPYPSPPKSKFPVPRPRPRPRGEIFPVPVPVGYMGIRWGENPREQQVPTAAAERPSRNPREQQVDALGVVDAWSRGRLVSRGAVPACRRGRRTSAWSHERRTAGDLGSHRAHVAGAASKQRRSGAAEQGADRRTAEQGCSLQGTAVHGGRHGRTERLRANGGSGNEDSSGAAASPPPMPVPKRN